MKSRRSGGRSKRYGGKKHKKSRKTKKDSKILSPKDEAKAIFDALLKMQ